MNDRIRPDHMHGVTRLLRFFTCLETTTTSKTRTVGSSTSNYKVSIYYYLAQASKLNYFPNTIQKKKNYFPNIIN
jgi:hypothetical protein